MHIHETCTHIAGWTHSPAVCENTLPHAHPFCPPYCVPSPASVPAPPLYPAPLCPSHLYALTFMVWPSFVRAAAEKRL